MNKQEQSRRDFLRTFAALSSTAALTQLLATCEGSSHIYVAAEYGPPPFTSTKITAMYFADSRGNQTVLQNASGVPLDANFEILFSADMQTNSLSLTFADAGNNSVQYALSWPNPRTAKLTPNSNLQTATKYDLVVSSGIDANGNAISTSNNSAIFITA